jgi:hypothetical protein
MAPPGLAPALTRRNHVSGGKDTVSADHGPPGHSRGGPLTTDRPTAENPGERLTSYGTRRLRQDAPRRAEPIQVWAHGYLVVGTRGRCRLVMVVPSCVFCGRPHSHNGRPDFTVGTRTASCHEGRYVVHLGTVAGSAAA